MKKLTLLMAGLMIAGISFAHDGGKNCSKDKKAKCNKEARAKCKKGDGCCKKESKADQKA